MTDAEYEELKYAAIAMGEKPVRLTDDGTALLLFGIDDPWNPRMDDGAALRLAAQVGMLECHIGKYGTAVRKLGGQWHGYEAHIYGGRVAATRLAITRAAAEIGKQMGGSDV